MDGQSSDGAFAGHEGGAAGLAGATSGTSLQTMNQPVLATPGDRAPRCSSFAVIAR